MSALRCRRGMLISPPTTAEHSANPTAVVAAAVSDRSRRADFLHVGDGERRGDSVGDGTPQIDVVMNVR